MKLTTYFLIIIYLIIFALGGYWFYNHYFHKANGAIDNSQSIAKLDQTILYAENNGLYKLNADVLNASIKDNMNVQLQSVGEIKTIALDKDNRVLYDEVARPDKIDEIWRLNLSDNKSEKLFSSQTPGLEDFSNFKTPKLSYNNQDLAFIATRNNKDNIFNYELKSHSLTNLTDSLYQGQIGDFDWSKTALDIYFSTLSPPENTTIKMVDLNKKIQNLWTGTAKIIQISTSKDRLIALYQDTAAINLGYFDLTAFNQINPITDLVSPKTIVNFKTNSTGSRIVYQVLDGTTKSNDLYIVNADGTNLLQLTNDGKSFFPCFSPDGTKIAYWVQNSGIFIIQVDKQSNQKILNDLGTINNIILWS